MKENLLVWCILLMSLTGSAQVFHLQSFDGRDQEVKVSCKDDRLTITSLKDTIRKGDVYYMVGAPVVLCNRFLKINFAVRAGSGMHDVNTLILCVDNQKLIQSLHITSLFHDDFIDFRKPQGDSAKVDVKTHYEVQSVLTELAGKYQLNTNIRDERQFRNKRNKGYHRHNSTTLNFDLQRHIFYNGKEQIHKTFTIFQSKTNRKSKRLINGNLPFVKLDTYKYYYLDRNWYYAGGVDELTDVY